jgi:type II secretory pathway component GspD/PulD (secretin)
MKRRTSVRKLLVIVAMLVGIVWVSGSATRAIAQQATPSAKQTLQNLPLEVQVVISRYQGDKRVSSLPYLLSLKSNSPQAGIPANSSLRLGSRVPVRREVVTPAADGKPATTTSSVGYENVGMNIDCRATALDDGRFEVTLTINETSVVSDPQDLKGTPDSYPVFRSYQSTNTVFVKDGQNTQFTAATDRVSGEVVRVEVKITVVK